MNQPEPYDDTTVRQPRRVSFHTLGCKLNVAESATLGRHFVEEGFTVVPFGGDADVVVLNTCSVTEKADRECRQLVRRARRAAPHAFVAVVGCYAQLRPEQIAAIPGVNLVAGSVEKFNILPYVLRNERTSTPTILRADHSTRTVAVPSHSAGIDRTRAFLKVQDGCDYSCAFCTIPLARGASRSVPEDAILADARTLLSEGFREIVLTGVNTADYGRKDSSSFVALLRSITSLDGLERLRISSVEPNLLSDDLLAFWFTESKLCKHWHIPLQSGSGNVLRGMRRRYTRDRYEDRVRMIKSAFPDAGIGADVIVGFPGETDSDFEGTYAFIRDLPLSYLHVFSYSERPNTEAIGLPDHVRPEKRAERSERLRLLGARKRRMFCESFVGKNVDVLFESPDEAGNMTGLTDTYIRVAVNDPAIIPNTRATVRIDGVFDEHCVGTPVQIIPRWESEYVFAR